MKQLFAIAVLLLISMNVLGQDDVVKVETGLVSVNVTVSDRNGGHVRGLSREDFTITDNGIVQKIETFSAEDAAASFGIIYDLHPTTDDRTANVLAAIGMFTNELREGDDFFVTVFNEKGSLTTTFVPTRDQLDRHLAADASEKTNSLYDVIFAASEKLSHSENSKKVLIVMTDGADNSSHHSLKKLKEHLRAVNLPVYSLTFDSGDARRATYSDLFRNGPRERIDVGGATAIDRALIEDVSRSTGGGSAVAESRDTAYLAAMGKRLLNDVRSQYVIGFVPGASDGKWHDLNVSLKSGKKGLKISSRKGYQSRKSQ